MLTSTSAMELLLLVSLDDLVIPFELVSRGLAITALLLLRVPVRELIHSRLQV